MPLNCYLIRENRAKAVKFTMFFYMIPMLQKIVGKGRPAEKCFKNGKRSALPQRIINKKRGGRHGRG